MSVMHMCQWGFWGEGTDESCSVADDYIEMDEDPDEPIPHTECGFFYIGSIDEQLDHLAESIGDLEGG